MPENCGLVPAVGSEFCPRHKFLAEMAAQKNDSKDGAKARAIGKALPNTRRSLITMGYSMRGASPCRDCHEMVEWFKTPAGKMAPYNSMQNEDSPAVSHFATCKFAHNFRKVS